MRGGFHPLTIGHLQVLRRTNWVLWCELALVARALRAHRDMTATQPWLTGFMTALMMVSRSRFVTRTAIFSQSEVINSL